MKHRPSPGARLHDITVGRLGSQLRGSGWRAEVVPFTGYGNEEHLRVLGRMVLRPAEPHTPLGAYAESLLNQRGWRNFLNAPVPNGLATVMVGSSQMELRTDRGGYIDVQVKNHGLRPGWHHVTFRTADGIESHAPVQIVSSEQTFGVISDIDDTILSTYLPRLLIAAWNSLVMTEGSRQAVPGMARLYQHLLAEHPGAPIVYVSTGTWNTLPFLNRFMLRHGFPRGPMLLSDLGPTNAGFRRIGAEHKRRALRELARDLPQIKWVLIGDNGQRDPALYREFAELQPDRVCAIAIRELTASELVLAHGTITILQDNANLEWTPPVVPEVFGADGDELAEHLLELLPQST